MRIKEFIVRVGFAVPMAIWVTFIVMVVFGIVANVFGAGSWFYCTVYCQVAIYLLIAAIAYAVFCQAKACWKN